MALASRHCGRTGGCVFQSVTCARGRGSWKAERQVRSVRARQPAGRARRSLAPSAIRSHYDHPNTCARPAATSGRWPSSSGQHCAPPLGAGAEPIRQRDDCRSREAVDGGNGLQPQQRIPDLVAAEAALAEDRPMRALVRSPNGSNTTVALAGSSMPDIHGRRRAGRPVPSLRATARVPGRWRRPAQIGRSAVEASSGCSVSGRWTHFRPRLHVAGVGSVGVP